MMKLHLIISILILGVFSHAWADPDSKFMQGLSKYQAGQNSEAITAWESVRSDGVASGALYYNLGNAYYRERQIGRAIFNYERARKLIPRDQDVINNLDLARLATVDKFENPIQLIIWQWVDKVRDCVSLFELATLFEILGLLSVLVFLGWKYGPMVVRSYLQPAFKVCLILFILSGAWYVWRSSLDARTFGVVLSLKTDVYSAPDEGSTQLFTLHEGAKIRTKEKLGGWINIRLADGRQGWIPQEDIGEI
jgi:hypothetical protein